MLIQNPKESLKFYENILKINKKSVGAMYGKAKSLEALAELEKSNRLLMGAISLYKTLLENYTDKLSPDMFKDVGERCVERMRFLGQHEQAVSIYEQLIQSVDDGPKYRNQLAVAYLLMNR